MSSTAITLPSKRGKADYPQLYEDARRALQMCARIDECAEWANVHHKLASYAKQSKDQTLFNYCRRIQARATRRMGELLQQIPEKRGFHRTPTETRTSAARAAGLSVGQRRTSLRVSRIPTEDFERAVESDRPPSVVSLARRGMLPATYNVIPPNAVPWARAFVRLKSVFRASEEVAADIDEIDDARDYFRRAVERDPSLASQTRALRLFAEQLESWLKDDAEREGREGPNDLGD